MTWLVGIFTYFLIWWVVIFMMLPIGLQRDDNPQKGNDTGAPVTPMIGKKIAYTTVVSTVIWLVLFGLTEIGVINYREIVSIS